MDLLWTTTIGNIMARIIPPQMRTHSYADAIAKGNRNAMMQQQMGQNVQNMDMAREQHQSNLQSADLNRAKQGLGMMLQEGRFVGDQPTYNMWLTKYGQMGIIDPNQMQREYTPEYMSQVLGQASKKAQQFTLSPGQTRFSPEGQEIASIPKETAPIQPETDPVAPWRNIADPGKRDEAKIRFGAKAESRIEKLEKDAAGLSAMNNDLDRFIHLNETNRTGSEYNIPLVGGAIGGVRSMADAEFQEMRSISDKLTPRMRQGMPGAASDRDVAMFRGATVGIGKKFEANKNIALGLKTANQNQIDRSQFYSNYLSERGHLRGAEKEWKEYLNANPIFDHKAERGSYTLNENRKSYNEWKTGGAAQQAAPQAEQPATVIMTHPQTRKRYEVDPVSKKVLREAQ